MSRVKKKSTLLRQWEMMRMLTVARSAREVEGRWDKASEIAGRLNDAGYEVSIRTVQRDLKELSEIFPIDLNDKNANDYGWRWRKGHNLNIAGMSVSEALAIRLVEMHMKQVLPTALVDGLRGVFDLAEAKLRQVEKECDNRAGEWLDKIRIIQPTQPLLAPSVNQDVQTVIYQALLENRQIAAHYQSMESGQTKEVLLHPLGLIMRGATSYLVASAWQYTNARLYALHRFSHADMLDDPVNPPTGFRLDQAIAAGMADFANQGEPIQLEMRCDEWVSAYLAETPLALDQTHEKEADGRIRIAATVNDTWQLRWWLLGQGSGIEVCNPPSLREEIKSRLREAIDRYA